MLHKQYWFGRFFTGYRFEVLEMINLTLEPGIWWVFQIFFGGVPDPKSRDVVIAVVISLFINNNIVCKKRVIPKFVVGTWIWVFLPYQLLNRNQSCLTLSAPLLTIDNSPRRTSIFFWHIEVNAVRIER